MLVEDIAADATKEVVGSRRHPIALVKDIIKDKHNRGANKCVDYSY
jgi:hypothetical protein